jgi:hypothetical protein
MAEDGLQDYINKRILNIKMKILFNCLIINVICCFFF